MPSALLFAITDRNEANFPYKKINRIWRERCRFRSRGLPQSLFFRVSKRIKSNDNAQGDSSSQDCEESPFFWFRTQPYNRNRIDWPEPYFCFTARVILKLLTCPLRLNDGIVSPRSTSLRGWEGWPVLSSSDPLLWSRKEITQEPSLCFGSRKPFVRQTDSLLFLPDALSFS